MEAKNAKKNLGDIRYVKVVPCVFRAKVQRYFDLIPEVLHQMFPADFDSLDEG